MVKLSTKQKMWLVFSICLLVAFVAFTLVVAFVDVDDGVGLSHLNQFFWQNCGKSETWETITDWLGYLTIVGLLFFIGLQIWQCMYRKSLRKVDWNLIALDIVCAGLVAVYIFFEFVVVNYRPMLENGVAKASYPSSHVMLFVTGLFLSMYQIWHYVKSKPWRIVLTVLISTVMVIGVVGRLLAGVHWFTDIFAGVLISIFLCCLYLTFCIKKINH